MVIFKCVTSEECVSGGSAMAGFNLEQVVWTVILIAVFIAYKFNVGLDGNNLTIVSSLF
jgi:hypothetical protein